MWIDSLRLANRVDFAQHVQAASVIAALPARRRRISERRMMHGKEHRSRVVLRLNALELGLKVSQLKIRHRRPLSPRARYHARILEGVGKQPDASAKWSI